MRNGSIKPSDSPVERDLNEGSAAQDRVVRLRHLGRVETVIIRDADAMRIGLRVGMKRISAAGLTIVSPVPLRAGEQVKVRLRNEVQRFVSELRGTIRSVSELSDEQHSMEIELFTRLLPLDVMMLRRAGAADAGRILGKVWV